MTSVRFPSLAGALLLSLAGLLAGCASGGYAPENPNQNLGPASAGDSAMASGDFLHAARAYQEAAQESGVTPAQAIELRLRAAEAAAAGNDFNLAQDLVAQLPAGAMNADQQLRSRIVYARAALARNDAARALSWLPADPGNLPSADRALLVRGLALYLSGDAIGATQTLVIRERYLHDQAAITQNHDTIWAGLGAATLDPTTLTRAGGTDSITRGWIELANLARRKAPIEFFKAWNQRYPGHPGEDRLAALFAPGAAANPAATATPQPATGSGAPVLLLPQTGALARVSEAVRAGYAAGATSAGAVAPQLIDDGNGAAQLADAAHLAISSGASMVVGPLLKDSVVTLSQLGTPQVPVLALNYLDVTHPAPAGFYQFGLAPEDEARAAAEDAVARGFKRALVLVQAGDWGMRVGAAFQQRLAEFGGRVVDLSSYSGEQESWSDPIKQLLRYRPIDDKKLLADLRAKAAPGVDPQRRNDFDFIFLGARSQDQARLLWPLFRFYHADRIPIYATAAVNSGPGDTDVAGIRFCDAPWLLDNSGTWTAFHDTALTGRGSDMARLYALGADAFTLSQKMTHGGVHAGDEIPGATGILRVGADGAIHRGLICAQLSVGPPVLLGSSAEATGSTVTAPPTPP